MFRPASIGRIRSLSTMATDAAAKAFVSIITPPKVTLKVLEEAKKLGVQGVWLQPGSFDDEILGYALKEFKAAVGGDGGRGHEGWCVLVDGERSAKAAGKSFKL